MKAAYMIVRSMPFVSKRGKLKALPVELRVALALAFEQAMTSELVIPLKR